MSEEYVLHIGPVPWDEDCQQVGTPHYDPVKAKKECQAFINQIHRSYGEEPTGTSIFVKPNPHDFGTYYDVVIKFDTEDEESLNYALNIEGDPLKLLRIWDDEARKELGL